MLAKRTISPSDSAKQRRLRDIIREKSLTRDRDFLLSSGKRSNYYFNLKKTMLDPEGANLIGDLLYGIISREREVDYIGGLASGAIPIVTNIVMRSHQGKPIRGFYVRDEIKNHGTMQLIEGHIDDGSNVILFDDVTTLGGSVMKAVVAVRARNCKVLKVISIVDRLEGASETFRREGIEFSPLFTTQDFNNEC
jgi:orotate phosphoribosyltransferase